MSLPSVLRSFRSAQGLLSASYGSWRHVSSSGSAAAAQPQPAEPSVDVSRWRQELGMIRTDWTYVK